MDKKRASHPHLRGVAVYPRGRYWWLAIGSHRQTTGLELDSADAGQALRAAEAVYYERARQAEGHRGYTVQQLIVEYLRVKSHRLQAVTVDSYTRAYELLLGTNREVADTATLRADVLAAVEGLWGAGYSEHTVRRSLVYVRSLFAYAIEQGYCTTNPVPRHLLPAKTTTGGHPLTDGEVAQVMDRLRRQSEAGRPSAHETILLVRLVLRSGVRVGEAMRMRGMDYDGSVLRVYGKPSPRVSGLRVREIPVDVLPGLVDVCDELWRGVAAEARVFTYGVNCHQANFREAARAVGVTGRIHELRDTAVNWWEKTLHIPEHLCARLAGHSVEVRRKHYDRPPTAEELREAIGRGGVQRVQQNVPILPESV